MALNAEPYLELSDNPVRFETANQLTSVFFDDSNKHVFAVRSGGVMGVVVKGPREEDPPLNFRMEDNGSLLSIKFSLDKKILAVQRTSTSVEFMNFNGSSFDTEYSQNCKKNSNILGFVWSQHNEVAFITDHGVELHLVIAEKKYLKLLKSISITTQWFVWCSLNKIALLASPQGSQLQPIAFKPGTINKLPKLDTDPARMAVERDVTLATLYNIPAVLIIRHITNQQHAEVHVHILEGPGQAAVKKYILKLGLTGRFAINIVDDLVIVHHQASRSSLVFDVSLPGESDGTVTYHTAAAPARSLKPASLALPGLIEPQTHTCELYSPNWVVFQPNIVIDAKLGCLWHIKLDLKALLVQILNLEVCTQLALKRTNAKSVLLELLLDCAKQEKPPLEKLQKSFNHINLVYRNWAEAEIQYQMATPSNTVRVSVATPRVLIDQNDMYTFVFQKLDHEELLNQLEWVLVSYVTSLSENNIPALPNINELVVTTLVKKNKFTAMQQLLQYGVIADSKPLACLLLSLGNLNAYASQLALDMLARLGATDEIQEILLSQNQVIPALSLSEDKVNPRKFLQAAELTKDPAVFHSTFHYFKSKPQHFSALQKDERLQNYIQHYKDLFIDKESDVQLK